MGTKSAANSRRKTQDVVIISAKLSETGSPCDPVPRKYCESSESLNQSGAASGWRGDSSSFLQSCQKYLGQRIKIPQPQVVCVHVQSKDN